jgi:hypothetical protein
LPALALVRVLVRVRMPPLAPTRDLLPLLYQPRQFQRQGRRRTAEVRRRPVLCMLMRRRLYLHAHSLLRPRLLLHLRLRPPNNSSSNNNNSSSNSYSNNTSTKESQYRLRSQPSKFSSPPKTSSSRHGKRRSQQCRTNSQSCRLICPALRTRPRH